jgi:hypothetical protein
MASRVHWVFMSGPGTPRFDHSARCYFQDYLRRRVLDDLSPLTADRVARTIDRLPANWRKAIPALQAIAVEYDFTNLTKKLRKLHLPKHLRKAKNPIYSWKNAA